MTTHSYKCRICLHETTPEETAAIDAAREAGEPELEDCPLCMGPVQKLDENRKPVTSTEHVDEARRVRQEPALKPTPCPSVATTKTGLQELYKRVQSFSALEADSLSHAEAIAELVETRTLAEQYSKYAQRLENDLADAAEAKAKTKALEDKLRACEATVEAMNGVVRMADKRLADESLERARINYNYSAELLRRAEFDKRFADMIDDLADHEKELVIYLKVGNEGRKRGYYAKRDEFFSGPRPVDGESIE